MSQRNDERRSAIIEVVGTSLLIGGVSGFGPLGTVAFKVAGMSYVAASIIATVVASLGVTVVMLVLDARGERRIFGGREKDDGA